MAIAGKPEACHPEDFARSLSLLGMIVSEKKQDETVEQMFIDAIKAAGKPSTFQKADALKYYALFLDSLEGRDEDVSINVLKAKEVLDDLGLWAPKLMHLVIRDLEY